MHEDIAVSLVDQRLLGMSGIQLLENVKQLRPNMLSILCSAYFDNNVLSQALNLGTVRGFISKPVQLNELQHRINEVIRQYYTPTQLVKEFSGSIYEERYVR